MEARAASLGNVPPLRYMFPENGGLNAADAARALAAGLPVQRIMPDLHVGGGGAVEQAATLFANPPVPGFNQSAINCETNAGSHDMGRALAEAADLLDWFNAPPAIASRLFARTASFCSERAGHFDNFDQVRGANLAQPRRAALPPRGCALATLLRAGHRVHAAQHDVAA